jgi:peptide deformylase
VVTIVQKGADVLRKKAGAVPPEEIRGPKIQSIIKEMIKALDEQEDGVAIAAPQIGHSVRIFAVSGKIQSPHYPDIEPGEKIAPPTVYVNPEITKLSREKEWLPEGCLSVRWLYGNVQRSTKATVEAYDENGDRFTRGASGLLAQIFQHEIDHLDGILFVDKAKDLEEAEPEEIADKRRKKLAEDKNE